MDTREPLPPTSSEPTGAPDSSTAASGTAASGTAASGVPVSGAFESATAAQPTGKARYVPRYPFLLEATIAGVLHGLGARLAFGYEGFKDLFGVMSFSFIFLVPFCLGLLTVYIAERKEPLTWVSRIFLPFTPAFIALVAAMLLAWEGLICIVLWLPMYLIMASLGGMIAGIILKVIEKSRHRHMTFASLMLLPFVSAPVEHALELPLDMRVVENAIDIKASPEVVWQHIIRVEKFRPEEHHRALSHMIGFPRPLEATLSHEGVGGVRNATFEGDVLFIETITHWEPLERLTFGIKADTSAIPPTTLDEHVTVGGPYFDVLEGEYRLEVLDKETVRLHLQSVHRLSTHFNVYSRLWTDFIMRDVQSYILDILKVRCEKAMAALPAPAAPAPTLPEAAGGQ